MCSKHITNTLGASRDKPKAIRALFQADEEVWRDLLMRGIFKFRSGLLNVPRYDQRLELIVP